MWRLKNLMRFFLENIFVFIHGFRQSAQKSMEKNDLFKCTYFMGGSYLFILKPDIGPPQHQMWSSLYSHKWFQASSH